MTTPAALIREFAAECTTRRAATVLGLAVCAGLFAELLFVIAAASEGGSYPAGGGFAAGFVIYLGVRLLRWAACRPGR